MTTEVINFDFRNNDVRVIEKDGEPWFVAADVCRVLGIKNTTAAVKPLREYEWSKSNLGQRGMGSALTVSESGLYKLVMRSDKPQARAFQSWIAEEVVPSIRKHGTYIVGQEQYFAGNLSAQEMVQRGTEAMASLLDKTQAQVAELQATVEEQRKLIASKEKTIARLKGIGPTAQAVAGSTARAIERLVRGYKGVNTKCIKSDLLRLGYFYRTGRNGSYRVYARYRDVLFEEKENPATEKMDIFVTPEGKKTLTRLYNDRQLTMKSAYH